MSWFSINLLLKNSSNLDPWNRFNSSISLKHFIWAPRRCRFCSDNYSWRSSWSRRSCSSPARVWSISFRRDSIIPFNSWILLLWESAWNSCFWISTLKSAKICSFLFFKENPDVFLFIFRDLVFLCTNLADLFVPECTKNDWTNNKLPSHEW